MSGWHCCSAVHYSVKHPNSPFLGRPHRHAMEPLSRQSFQRSGSSLKVNAIFWGPKKTVEPHEMDISLGAFTLTGSASEGISNDIITPQKIFLSMVSSISDISPEDWDACAVDASGPGKHNPFLTHAFLSSLEESGCAVKETGWSPLHIIARDEYKNIIGVVPLYLKSHSYGEFVFDYSWADVYYSYGSNYYPKLQSCVPFTPVTGHRILLRDTWCRDQVFSKLISAMKELTAKLQVSSFHVTFPSEHEWHKMKEHGFLQRIGMQYHWKNRNYKKVLIQISKQLKSAAGCTKLWCMWLRGRGGRQRAYSTQPYRALFQGDVSTSRTCDL